MDGNDVRSSFSWKIEEAKVFWCQGEQETAMRQLKQIHFNVKVKYVDLICYCHHPDFYVQEICIIFSRNIPNPKLGSSFKPGPH